MLARLRTVLPRAAVAVSTAAATATALTNCERFVDLPAEVEDQRFVPAVRWGAWDRDWDRCELTEKDVAAALKHSYPITDYAEAIRKIFRDHASHRSQSEVERMIANGLERNDLPAVYKRAYLDHAFGGATVRHMILVRHGQYEEQRELYRPLAKADRDFGLPLDDQYKNVDEKQVLTDLGRRQAETTGRKLRELLAPALETPGRDSHVRIHVSTLTRAKETADIIAKHLPGHVRRLTPDPNLAEGWPLAHRIPFPEGVPQEESRDVHIEGARIEAAFRGLFYRGKPGQPPVPAPASALQGRDLHNADTVPRHDYDIIVCHGNVIRYFVLRALQLPPEAWLRLCTFNCSISHLVIWPHGSVSCNSVGDVGHLSLDETTFSMHHGYEW